MPENNKIPPDMDRLRWQCRRGMLELDEILLRYLEERFVQSSAEEQGQFRELLDIEDPVLNVWLILGDVPVGSVLERIVDQVRAR